jgi:hypothetical protein
MELVVIVFSRESVMLALVSRRQWSRRSDEAPEMAEMVELAREREGEWVDVVLEANGLARGRKDESWR